MFLPQTSSVRDQHGFTGTMLCVCVGGVAPSYGRQQLMAARESNNNKKKRLSLHHTLRGRVVRRENRVWGGREEERNLQCLFPPTASTDQGITPHRQTPGL